MQGRRPGETTMMTEMERERRRHRWGDKIGCPTTLFDSTQLTTWLPRRKGQNSTEEDTAWELSLLSR